MTDFTLLALGIVAMVAGIIALSRRHRAAGAVLLGTGMACEVASIVVSANAIINHLTLVDLYIFLLVTPIAFMAYRLHKQQRNRLCGAFVIALGLVALYAAHYHSAYYSAANTVISYVLDLALVIYGITRMVSKTTAPDASIKK